MLTNKTMRPLQLLLWTVLSVLLNSSILFAQTVKVTGTVINQKTSAGVPSATITVKNTTRSTSTNAEGKFSIEAAPDDVLVITSVGFTRQEVKAGSGDVSIQLVEAENRMEEVVVIGYGVQKRRLVTGSSVSVKGEDLSKQSTTDALQALQGQAPGVQITSTSGQPGSGMNVVIRGKGTIGNAGPLYVVDGVYTNDISYLNPADIQSMDVLKDAASAAIYGSQAANGVIIVTTRTGRTGQRSQVTLDAFYGWQSAPRKAQLLNSKEYGVIMNEAAINSGKVPYFTNDQIANFPTNTNWMDEMFVNNAPNQNYVLGVSGAGGSSVYSTSLAYTGQQGIVGGAAVSNFERYTFRVNTEHGLFKNIIKLGQHLTFNYQKSNGIAVGNQYNNSLRGAFNTSPFVPMYDTAGNFFNNRNSTWNNGEANPYAIMILNNQNRNNSQRLFGDVYVAIEPVKGLHFRSSLGVNLGNSEGRSYSPIYDLSIYAFNNNTFASQSMGRDRGIQFDNQLSYNFKLNGLHSLDAMVGSSARSNTGSGMYGRNRDLVFSGLQYAWLSNATNTEGTNITLNGSPYEEALMSYFGRVQYNFNEKYLLSATFRADGSSKFAPGNRTGYFPSVSAGWVATKENFMQDLRWLSFLKVRASWGRLGNQNIMGYQFLAPVSFSNTNYNFGPLEGVSTPGAYPSRLANPDVRWEASQQTNLGFDATVKRLNITFDYYVKDTKDWLIQVPILATGGAEAPFINGGTVRNTGVELGLSYHSNLGALNYTVGVNGAYNKNRIRSIPTADQIVHGNTNSLYDNSLEFYRAQNGFPVGYFWGLKTAGLFQNEQEVAGYNKGGTMVQPTAQPGDVKYVDLNNDGIINDLDRTIIGDPNPDLTYGFTLSADYKGFDFNLLLSGVAGNQIVQSWRNQSNSKANYSAAILDRWHGEGTSNKMPRVTEDNRNWTQFSDLYIHKGDFLRVSNITVGYDFSKIARKSYLGRLRLYASALNLYTFTRYNGMDPEIGYGEGFSSGVDLGYYPRPRTLMIGANIRF